MNESRLSKTNSIDWAFAVETSAILYPIFFDGITEALYQNVMTLGTIGIVSHTDIAKIDIT